MRSTANVSAVVRAFEAMIIVIKRFLLSAFFLKKKYTIGVSASSVTAIKKNETIKTGVL